MGTLGNPNWSYGIDELPIDDQPLSDGHPDPVKQYKDGWYFWSECWTERCGPFKTRKEAETLLDKYIAKNVL